MNLQTTALLVIDLQGDFTTFKDGSLAVPGSDADYLQRVREAVAQARADGQPLFATLDWHPAEHISFFINHPQAQPFELKELADGRNQVLWPPHCVQESDGAAPLLPMDEFDGVIKKGSNPQFDSYSGFFDDGGADTGLHALLQKRGIQNVQLCGLAFDYCVKATALDAVRLGYTVTIFEDLTASVAEESAVTARKELLEAGVTIC